MKNLFLCLILLPSLISCQQEKVKNEADKTAASGIVADIGTDRDQHRPFFHFTPPEKWMNDPNGMVFFEGEYHLFYQHYPDSTVWGPMHWGHAVSKDLVTWEHLPIALYPDSLGYIFSGSAVIDWNNTSGFGQNDQPPMIAIFTHHDPVGAKAGTNTFQYQSIAYSNDKGRTWTKYAGNPVVPNPGIRDFRDPKVIWDDASNQWIMAFAAWDHLRIYGSPDLRNWTYLSNFGKEWGAHGGVWECPDLFPMTIEGTEEKRWILLQSLNPGSSNGGSGTQYFVGNFDGTSFRLDEDFKNQLSDSTGVWLDFGRDNYAGVTWSDIPSTDGRRLFMGWMSNWDYAQVVPTKNWRSAMTVARELTLRRTTKGLFLASSPVTELQRMHQTPEKITPWKGTDLKLKLSGRSQKIVGALSLSLAIPKGEKTQIIIELSNAKNEKYRVGYDAGAGVFFSDRTQSGKTGFSDKFARRKHLAPRLSEKNHIDLQVLLDIASAELFADDGLTVMTDIFFPNEDYSSLEIRTKGGTAEILHGTMNWY